jgi:hypothetical protein
MDIAYKKVNMEELQINTQIVKYSICNASIIYSSVTGKIKVC